MIISSDSTLPKWNASEENQCIGGNPVSFFFLFRAVLLTLALSVCQSVHQGVGGAGGAQDSGATLEILSMEWRSWETKRRVSASSSSWLEVDKWVGRQTDRQKCYNNKSLIPSSFMNFHKYQDICKTWRSPARHGAQHMFGLHLSRASMEATHTSVGTYWPDGGVGVACCLVQVLRCQLSVASHRHDDLRLSSL